MMEEDLPIDIHYNKLLDWLLSRRHCNQNWQQLILTVRQKISTAIQDMPAVDDVAKLLHGAYINYFHCVEIMRLLKLTEDNSRNIFGRYSSQRLKDWTEILKLYEKDDLYLAEAAQLLARNVNYEIPSLKRQIAKCVQAQQDYSRKETEYAKLSADLQENYNTECKQMGIEGKKVKRELMHLVRDLPTTYEGIVSAIQTRLPAAVQYYSDFVAFILSRDVSSGDCLPLVRFVISHGNVTVFEFHSGKKPSRIEDTSVSVAISNDEEGDGDEKNGDEVNEIDWGDVDVSPTENINEVIVKESEAATDEIDWLAVDDIGSGIEVEVTGDRTHQPTAADDCSDADVARGDEALTLLDNTSTRNSIVNELMELESFLEQRLREVSCDASDDVLAAVILQMAPQSVHCDQDSISKMLTDVTSILSQLTSQRMRDLMLIRSSPRYVDRLCANLKKMTSDAAKMTSLSHLMSTRRLECVNDQRDIEPLLDLLRQKTKELQKQIESEISKRYKNRRVNIMGEINTI